MIVGIDPDLHGALALLGDNSELLDLADMPTMSGNRIDPYAITRILSYWDTVKLVVIESLPHIGMSGGRAALLRQGQSSGTIVGVAAALGHRIGFADARVWTATFKLSSDKNSHRAFASKQWPEQAGMFSDVIDHGLADAALIALWARLHPFRVETLS